MKIRAVIASKDEEYNCRLSKQVSRSYSGKIVLYIFTDIDVAIQRVTDIHADILAIDDDCRIDENLVPKRCTIVYLVETVGIQNVEGKYAVAKYQSVRNIVSDFLDIFVSATAEAGIRVADGELEKKSIITFFPGAGGVGNSTLAAAYAVASAEKGKRVLYLNLEKTGSSDLYFSGQNKNNFNNVIYALEMDNAGTAVKIENALNQDHTGVWFFSACTTALDMQDMHGDRYEVLFEQLMKIKLYDIIVVDMEFSLDEDVYNQIERSNAVIFVSDGNDAANYKLRRISHALETLASQRNNLLKRKMYLMYNKFSSVYAKKADDVIFTEVGGIPKITNASIAEIVRYISQNSVFNSAFEELLGDNG